MPLDLAAQLSAHGVAPLIGLDDALTAFEAAAFIGRNWARRDAPVAMVKPDCKDGRESVIGESAAKSLLKAHGLRVPEGIVCRRARRWALPRGSAIRDAQGLVRCHRPQDGGRRRGTEPSHSARGEGRG